ncbi:MAG: hypothetical protein M0P29_05665 [Sphaerochaetaceae bacterium]|nr:hypothetical protein [Sphaerochaetaceae bacterium]MDD3996307.1 hypothetical protein [Sphaerochaetaceae bacterium]MDD4842318.1 hypothetical protein [Sphaerochaetaceae bacterium]
MRSAIVFFDDYWLDVKRGVRRRYFKPKWLSTYVDPLNGTSVYASIQWCPEIQKYRTWYEVIPKIRVDALRYLAVAESTDGIQWQPVSPNSSQDPAVEECPHAVYSGNGGVHGTSVFRDQWDTNPEARYKATGMTRTWAGQKRPPTLPVRLSTSPDGINWKEQDILHEYTSDALNCLFYNPWDNTYSALLRTAYVDRRIFQTDIPDINQIHNHENPRLVVHPDASYEAPLQLYSMWGGWNDGIFLGLLMRYWVDLGNPDYSTMQGYQDSELMYSYDGKYWLHTNREALIERNLPQQHGHCQLVSTGMTLDATQTKHIIVSTGARFMHSTTDVYERLLSKHQESAHVLFFHEIRKDGFVGLESCGFDAEVTTKTIELEKEDLSFNVSVPYGSLSCALLNPDGTAIEGFSFEHSIPFTGDSTEHSPQWETQALSSVVGKRIRIALRITCGVLYAIHATMRPSIRVSQKSFGDFIQLCPERPEEVKVQGT